MAANKAARLGEEYVLIETPLRASPAVSRLTSLLIGSGSKELRFQPFESSD